MTTSWQLRNEPVGARRPAVRLQAEQVRLAYGELVVVDGLDFAVLDGTITAVIGPNGCGKSTLLRALGRLMKTARGRILLDGKRIDRMPTREVAKVLGVLPQSPSAPEGLTTQVVGELTSPNLEEIAALNPDLILSAKVRHEQIYDKLSAIAPTVFSEKVSTWKSNLMLTGRALGRKRQAKAKIEAFQQSAQTIGDAIRANLGHNPAVSLVRFAGDPTVRLYTRESYPGRVIYGAVGLARPADAPTADGIAAELSPERIPALDAEYILLATYPGGRTDKPEQVRAQFQNTPLWQKLTGTLVTVSDRVFFSSVGLLGAQEMLDKLAKIFDVDPTPRRG